jgi:hypothetical protein
MMSGQGFLVSNRKNEQLGKALSRQTSPLIEFGAFFHESSFLAEYFRN